MKHVFIINPSAGKGRDIQALDGRIHAACKAAGLDYAVSHTECAGDGVRLTRDYAAAGDPIRVYACGGDGTLNEVVQAAAGLDHVAVTNVPTGTGNDFLKIFGEGFRERFSDLPALFEGPQAALDLIECNGRFGLDIICAGVDARVADDVAKYKGVVGGMGAYILALGENLIFKSLHQEMEVDIDGEHRHEPITLVCVCNGRYYGGGFMPVGEAMPDDGVLDILVVKKVSKLTFFKLVGAYAKGGYARFPDLIRLYRGAGPVTLRAGTDITAVADGEVMRDREFTIKLSDKKLKFFYPQGMSWK